LSIINCRLRVEHKSSDEIGEFVLFPLTLLNPSTSCEGSKQKAVAVICCAAWSSGCLFLFWKIEVVGYCSHHSYVSYLAQQFQLVRFLGKGELKVGGTTSAVSSGLVGLI